MPGRAVTIDGPAASGKSTVARALARRLGFAFLPTGLHYRLATYAAEHAGLAPDGGPSLAAALAAADLRIADHRAFHGGTDVTDIVVGRAFGPRASAFAEVREVRDWVNVRSRAFAAGRDVVSEGRDQGTVVFPEAPCKFFVTAPAEVRAARRCAEPLRPGESPKALAEILAELVARDRRDSHRALAPLRQAPDAVLIDTAELPIDAVVDRLEALARAKLGR